jgi:Uma2 family endonuclease
MVTETKKLTREDFLRIAESPEYHDRIVELVNGEIVEKMVSIKPSSIAARIGGELYVFLKGRDLGTLTTTDGCYRMLNGDLLCPDVAFISKLRLPEPPERESPVPPDLAVEVKSPADSIRALRRKAEQYQDSSVRLVWLFLPESRQVEVYAAGQDVVLLGPGAELDGGDVLPGFSLAINTIFPT